MTDERSREAGLPERAHHAGRGKPAAPRQRRRSAQRKQEAVLRVLRGEDLELVSREIGATATDLSGCRKRGAARQSDQTGDPWDIVDPKAASQIARLRATGRKLTRNDLRVIVTGQLIRVLSQARSPDEARAILKPSHARLEAAIDDLAAEGEPWKSAA